LLRLTLDLKPFIQSLFFLHKKNLLFWLSGKPSTRLEARI
jgi:hypothetical protein